MKIACSVAYLIFFLFTSGCTSNGFLKVAPGYTDFGSSEKIRICFVADNAVPQEQVVWLISTLQRDLATYYAIDLDPQYLTTIERPGFTNTKLLRHVINMPLEDRCDRLIYFVGRNVGDVLWGLVLLPEVLGEVDETTRTKGYVVASIGSFQQFFMPPEKVLLHEMEHLLGCSHHVLKTDCYATIVSLKSLKKQNREAGIDFFPSIAFSGKILRTHVEVSTFLSEK